MVPPPRFETVVLNAPWTDNELQWPAFTWVEAQAQHEVVLADVSHRLSRERPQ